MITQEQTKRAIELLKEAPKILAIAMTKDIAAAEKVYGEWGLKRKKLLQEIEANAQVTTTNATEYTEVKAKPWDGKEILVPSALEVKGIVTNGDRIRNMSDEELAKKLAWHFGCRMCQLATNCDSHSLNGCENMFEEWLKQEAKQ